MGLDAVMLPPILLGAPASPGRLDTRTVVLLSVVLGLLSIAQIVTQILKQQPDTSINPAQVRSFNRRLGAWWMICSILVFGFLLDYAIGSHVGTVVLFFLVSFWALREFITMTPTRRGDHRTLFWTFFLFTPLQYILVGFGRTFYDVPGHLENFDFYSIYSILIPVYASLFVPARIAFSGDPKRFLERSAKIQAGLLICVYSLSYAPALLDLNLMTRDNASRAPTIGGAADEAEDSPEETAPEPGIPPGWKKWKGSTAGLLFYLVLVVQLGDVLQYAWGKLLGKHVIAPAINASKTWEGFIGAVLSSTLVGALFWFVTPFTVWGSATMAFIIAAMGFAGTMTMSAIKRDRGVRDYGTLVQGHAGVLDRIDSLCFAAPVFYHLTRFFLNIEV